MAHDDRIIFTDSGIVCFNNKEMKLNHFMTALDNNIESDKYNVYYNDKEGFRINYNDKTYSVQLSRDMEKDKEKNPIFKHLLMLSHVEEHIDIKSQNTIDEDIDEETKEFYLQILKNNNKSGSIKSYFNNLGSDIVEVFYKTKDNVRNKYHDILSILFIVSALVTACIFGGLAASTEGIKISNGGFIIAAVVYGLQGLGIITIGIANQIKIRTKRLSEYIELKKIRKLRLKALENKLSTNKLCIEQKEDIVEMKIERTIPVYINNLIESLKEVPLSKRGPLKQSIKELALLYYEKIDDSSKKDSEIAAESPEILTMMNQIEMRIHEAKKIDIQREKEVEYLLEKLANVEVEEEQVETNSDEIQKGLRL